MDDEQRKYFGELLSTMEGVASDARAAASTSRETAATVRKLDARVGVVEGQVAVLHTHVFGKPPTSEPPAPMRPIAESVNEHGGEIATLTGQVLAVAARVETIVAETEKQKKKLGLEPESKALALIRNANTKDIVKVLTLIAAIIAAWKGIK